MDIHLQTTSDTIEIEMVQTEEEGMSVKVRSADAEMTVERSNFKLTLVPVRNFGEIFFVPTTNLGHSLTDCSPLEVSTLALQYLERIVRDGAELSK